MSLSVLVVKVIGLVLAVVGLGLILAAVGLNVLGLHLVWPLLVEVLVGLVLLGCDIWIVQGGSITP